MENFPIFLFFGNPACRFFFFFFLIKRKTKGNDKYAQSDNKDIVLGIGWCKKAFNRRKKNVQESLAMQSVSGEAVGWL